MSGLIDKALTAVNGWKGYALTAVVAASLAGWTGWTVRDWKAAADEAAAEVSAEKARTAAVAAALARERSQTVVTATVEAQAVAAQAHIQTITRTLIKEVPIYVTAEADRRCIVPAGFVRLHDAAAGGVPVPDAAGEPDDAPSGVELSAVAATVVENYGTVCRATIEQVKGWQAWARGQMALEPRSTAPR